MHAILQKAHLTRKAAEHAAKQLLQRLDRSCGVQMMGCSASPWEELSSNSRTTRYVTVTPNEKSGIIKELSNNSLTGMRFVLESTDFCLFMSKPSFIRHKMTQK